MTLYPFKHQTIGQNIIGKPAKRHPWSIRPLAGLGAVQPYRYPYYNPSAGYQYQPGIPYAYYLALLQQQQANWNYGRYGYGPYQTSYPYSSYPYAQNQQQQYYYVPYSSCVGSGGLWDSFANACTSATSTNNTPYQYQPYGTSYPFTGGYPNQAMPSVVGLSFASGVAALNNAGFQVWELSRDGVGEGVPPGYLPNRAVITVNNNIITSVYQG